MAAFARSLHSDSESDSSGRISSTPSSGYIQVGLSENTNLPFEKNSVFLNCFLLFILLGGTFICASVFYYSVPLRHALTASVRNHLANTPFKEGDSSPHLALEGGWVIASTFSKTVDLSYLKSNAAVDTDTGLTIAAGAVTTWADVEAWLLKVLAPTLYTGSLGGTIVVQSAILKLTKGSITANTDTNTKGIALGKLHYDAAGEKTVDFGEVLQGTYAVDATSTIQQLGAEGWWGPLTTEAEMTIQGRDGNGNGCVANVFFEQLPSGLVTATIDVDAVLTSKSAFALAFTIAFFLVAIGYCVVEWAAFNLAKKTRRFDDDRSPLYRYLEARWPCTLIAITSLTVGLSMLICCILSMILTRSEFNPVGLLVLEVLEGLVGVLVMVNAWAFILRLLHALSGASTFFLVMEKTVVTTTNEFGGIFVVAILLLLGAASCNFVLLGPRVSQFHTFGSSVFYTVCLTFGAPFIHSMPPVAFIVAVVGLLVFWVVLVPLLVAINIQSLSCVVKRLHADQRENLGYDLQGRVQEWMENNLFFCTPDPRDHNMIDEELQARLRHEDQEAVNHEDHKEKVLVSVAEDIASLEYRKLLLAFIPFMIFFTMAICFLCDPPLVHREFERSLAQILQPFSTTDPFVSADATATTPVWMLSHADCNPTPKSFPATKLEGVRRPLQLSRVQSLGGVYDWLEQVLAGQILNAAFNSPTTTNAIPLANPGAVLVLTRLDIECQTFGPLTSVYPVRRKRAVFRNYTSTPFGSGDFRATTDRIYRVPIYFTGSDAPSSSRSRRTYRRLAAVSDGDQELFANSNYTQNGIPRRLSDHSTDIHWTAADFEEIYVGPSSMRTKMEHLRSQKFLDWQLYQLDILWMSYNGDSSVFVLNKVRVQVNDGGLETSFNLTAVPAWHFNPFETGVRPEIILMPLAVVCLIGYLFLSYTAVQKRRLPSFYLVALDLPIAVTFACCCFFLLCMYKVAFDPGWTDDASLAFQGSRAKSTGNIPKFVPGPVQPWQWLPGSSDSTLRSQPPPSAESLPRFLRLQEHLEIMANYLLYSKICAGLLFLCAMIRFVTMIRAVPERLQSLRKLFDHLNASKMQTACALGSLFTTFMLFCFVGHCVLGGSYDGFSSFAKAIVSCVMVTHAKWNFNSITTVAQQGRGIGWLFQVFLLMICACFFGFMNYIVLSIVYVRYESLKVEEGAEMQKALQAKYGVVQQKRVHLAVNDTVILYFKAFVKCLSLQAWGVSLAGNQPRNQEFIGLKDEFFMALRRHPLMARQPRTTREYISKALLATQIVRLQQCLTDIEFLRAKNYLILHDLGVIAEQMRLLRSVTRRQGKYVAGIEAAIQHVNTQIEEVQTRKAFISYYNEQDPMHAKQQLEQKQLLDLGMDAGREYAKRAIADPRAYIPPEVVEEAPWEDHARQQLIEEQRQRHLKENTKPPTLHEARRRRMQEKGTKHVREQEAPTVVSPRVAVAGLGDPSAALSSNQLHRPAGMAPWKGTVKPAAAAQPHGPLGAPHVDSDDEDWDSVRQRFGGDRQGTLEIRERDGKILLVKPFPEPPAEALPGAQITNAHKPAAGSPLERSKSAEDAASKAASTATVSAAGEIVASTDFFADDKEPRPTTNAPDIAEQRSLELATLRQRPPQGDPSKRNRRAQVRLPTFEAGGQDYRMLPRRRGRKS